MIVTGVKDESMKMIGLHDVVLFLDRILGVEKSERRTTEIKQEAQNRVDEVTNTMAKAGKLQSRVIQRTTTYYLGKAAGVIKEK